MIVTLECTESRAIGATPSRYTTQKVRGQPWAWQEQQQPAAAGIRVEAERRGSNAAVRAGCFNHSGGSTLRNGTLRPTAPERCPAHAPPWRLAGLPAFPAESVYHTSTLQNKKNTPERMELMKYNKYLRRMTLHKVGGRACGLCEGLPCGLPMCSRLLPC